LTWARTLKRGGRCVPACVTAAVAMTASQTATKSRSATGSYDARGGSGVGGEPVEYLE